MARKIQASINEKQKQFLVDYYTNWDYDPTIDLRFRFVKILSFGLKDKSTRWIFMNRYCNKRRMNYEILKSGILSLLGEKFVPLRVFHSVAEWISPNEIDRNPDSLWIKNSGFIPLENDDSLEISIQSALAVSDKLQNQNYLVYSGNKSIHVWWTGFDFENYLNLSESHLFGSARRREKMERRARSIFYEQLQKEIPYTIDHRNATDPRRVVPIINTINCLTGRRVTSLTSSQLHDNTAESLRKIAEIKEWYQ